MRTALVLAWLVLPLFVGAYHYGPGQQHMLLDDAAAFAASGDRQAASADYVEAVRSYNAALAALPTDHTEARQRIRLERAKARLLAKQLPEAHEDLTALVAELQQDAHANAELLASARDALANSQYYLTWLMRLEGAPKEAWEPEIESARQIYRLLAEQSESRGDKAQAKTRQEDLESAIRLARMDLTELQGLPLPSQ